MERSLAQQEQTPLPVMTHLLALQQTPGRIRFIFRGEWMDETTGGNCLLKLPPGDTDSIEAKWVTLHEVRCLNEGNRKSCSPPLTEEWKDQWLRGPEPVAFFAMLESSRIKGTPIPGLSVSKTSLECADNKGEDNGGIGAFFSRMGKPTENCTRALLKHRGRDALITHLRSRLLIYDEAAQKVAIDGSTLRFPLSVVSNQFEQTLRQLVDEMIHEFSPRESACNIKRGGTLRMEYIIHPNGTDATLTVFSYLIVSTETNAAPKKNSTKSMIKWVWIHELVDSVENNLAKVLVEKGGDLSFIDILTDSEWPSPELLFPTM